MQQYLKLFETENNRTAYENSESYIEPYVSYVEGDNTVHYNKPPETRVVATFNITSTSSRTRIRGYSAANLFDDIEIDGVSVGNVEYHTFDTTGEHIIKYTLKDKTSIGNYAFQSCTSLTSVTIPDNITSIGERAFNYCSILTNITIPNGVTIIDNEVFSQCYSLRSVTIPNGVTSINYGAFDECRNLASVTIPNSVTTIGNYAFNTCSSLTSISIPDSVTSIGSEAFKYCSRLTSVTIGNGVTSIDDHAFEECMGLTNLIIGSGVTSIGIQAFNYCSSLMSITIEATTPPTLMGYSSLYNTNNCPIYVPSQSVEAYKTADIWKDDYASRIQAIPTT